MFSTTTTVVTLVFLTSLSSSGDKSPTPEDLMPELKVLVESLPSIVTMLLTGGDLDLGPFGDIADEWFTKTVPDLRRIVDTLSTLIKMAFKIVDKIEGTPDRVEVETGQLIFKGIFTSGEELVMTVVPVLDFLPEPIKSFVSKETILKLLNIDIMKEEFFDMSEETTRVVMRHLKTVPKKIREEGLSLLTVLGKMLRLVEEDADFSRFDELFSQVLQILPAQVENVQEMFADLSTMDQMRKKSVIFNPDKRHQEL